MFSENRVRNFIEIRKVAIYSLLGRNLNSSNSLIEFIAYSSRGIKTIQFLEKCVYLNLNLNK